MPGSDIRNDERYKNLNFSEIAKLVGVQWKKLDPTQKQTFELKAKQAKATYHLKLANYRETVEYRQYKMYFLEFKKQQAQKQGMCVRACWHVYHTTLSCARETRERQG